MPTTFTPRLRWWDLAADPAELDAVAVFASGQCKDTAVAYTAAP